MADDNLRVAQPGEVLNPLGLQNVPLRRGRKWLREALTEIGAQPSKTNPDRTVIQEIAQVIVDAALRGERWAIREFGNRVDGVAVKLDVNIQADLETLRESKPDYSRMSRAELAARAKKLYESIQADMKVAEAAEHPVIDVTPVPSEELSEEPTEEPTE
jgi:hypothetical protein